MSTMTLIPLAPSIDFEDRTLYFSNIEGQWWIALKPIIESLGLQWPTHFEALKKDPVFSQLFGEHRMVASDGKTRKMICLPERFIYGWICGLQSRNPKLIAFRMKCYNVLYEYFHGGLSNRKAALREQVLAKREMERLRRELSDDARYQRLQELQGVVLAKGKELKLADRAIEQEQLTLFAHMSQE